jgi:hypothetical protein
MVFAWLIYSGMHVRIYLSGTRRGDLLYRYSMVGCILLRYKRWALFI